MDIRINQIEKLSNRMNPSLTPPLGPFQMTGFGFYFFKAAFPLKCQPHVLDELSIWIISIDTGYVPYY